MPLLKRLERSVRRGVLRVLARRSSMSGSQTIELPDRPRILLVRTDRIGDVVVSTPTIVRLRARYPNAQITILLGAKNAAIGSLIPGVDERAVLPVSLPGALTVLRQLRARRCDLAINLVAGGSATAALVTAFVRARWSIGFAGEGDEVLSHRIALPDQPEHLALTTSRLLAPLGLEALREDEPLSLLLPSRTTVHLPENTALFLPSVGDPTRRWSENHWIELGRTLLRDGMHVAVLGAPNDREQIEKITRESGADVVQPSGSLAEFAATVAQAMLVVAPDTASVHIAAATGRPVVMLSGEIRSARSWYPWSVPYRLVRSSGSIAQIAPAEVHAAVLDLAFRSEKRE